MEKIRKIIIAFTIIFALIIILSLVIVKINNPAFKLGQIFLYSSLVILFVVIIFFFVKYYKNKKNEVVNADEEKLPRAITAEQAREIARKLVENPIYADYIPDCLGHKIINAGTDKKSRIYVYMAKGKYENETYVVLLNMHYPYELNSVLLSPKNDYEITRAIESLAIHPRNEPNVRVIANKNILTGQEQVIQEPVNEVEKTEESKKEDL